MIDYDYGTYGNLIKISGSVGNSVNYRYDSEGNRLSEEIRDPQNVLHKSLSYQYDSLKRLSRVTNPDGTTANTATIIAATAPASLILTVTPPVTGTMASIR